MINILLMISLILNCLVLLFIFFIKSEDEILLKKITLYKKMEEKYKKKIRLDYSDVIEKVAYSNIAILILLISKFYLNILIDSMQGIILVASWIIISYSGIIFLGVSASFLGFVSIILNEKKYIKTIFNRLNEKNKIENETFKEIKNNIIVYDDGFLSTELISEIIKLFLMINIDEENSFDEKSREFIKSQEILIQNKLETSVENYVIAKSKKTVEKGNINEIEKIFNY